MPFSGHSADSGRATGRSGSADARWEHDVAARVRDCRDRIKEAQARGGHGQEVVLVAVTKTHGIEAVNAAFNAGVLDIGENRVQEAESKMSLCELPVRWHLIGHLQRNKARSAARFSLVHGVDSERISAALHDVAEKQGRSVDVLVQVNVSGEQSKSGVEFQQLQRFAADLHRYPSLAVRGVMTMAPFDADEQVLRSVFSGARDARTVMRNEGHPASLLSMGMSGDFEIAVEEGATHVRLGTVLFGNRY